MRTPFRVGQSIDDVLKVMKRTNRKCNLVKIRGREGTFTIDTRRKSNRVVNSKIKDLSLNLRQNLTVWYYLDDCILVFKRNRGEGNTGASCYRVASVLSPSLS